MGVPAVARPAAELPTNELCKYSLVMPRCGGAADSPSPAPVAGESCGYWDAQLIRLPSDEPVRFA